MDAAVDGGLNVRILELWRYPVKSLQGELLETAQIGPEGITGDRQWALFDADTGFGLTARRVPDLLFASGRLRPDGGVEVEMPDGTTTTDDDALSRWLGRPVSLRAAGSAAGSASGRPRYESPDDDVAESAATTARWHDWQGAPGAFHDNADGRISLVCTGTLGVWDHRRFRSNVLLEGADERGLVGSSVRLGSAVLEVRERIPRCVMVTRPQPGGIERDTSVLKRLHRERGGELAAAAVVRTGGAVRVGDELAPA